MKNKKPIDPDTTKNNLGFLTDQLSRIDNMSQNFLDLESLTPGMRLELNTAFRVLKRQIIFAQTELWKKLIRPDQDALLDTPIKNFGGQYELRVEPIKETLDHMFNRVKKNKNKKKRTKSARP